MAYFKRAEFWHRTGSSHLGKGRQLRQLAPERSPTAHRGHRRRVAVETDGCVAIFKKRQERERHLDLDELFNSLLRAPRPIVPVALQAATR